MRHDRCAPTVDPRAAPDDPDDAAEPRRRAARARSGRARLAARAARPGAHLDRSSRSPNDRFLTAFNLTNLALQIAAIGTISVGVVLVLLLGEIDLSVGAVSGLCAAVMAVLNVKHGWAPYLAIVAGARVGAAIGLFQGRSSTRFGIPSFVVTLAGLMAWQGALLQVLGDTGTVNLATRRSPTSPARSSATASAGSSRWSSSARSPARRCSTRRRRAGGLAAAAARRRSAIRLARSAVGDRRRGRRRQRRPRRAARRC